MKMIRTFHPVGHGAFYTERFYDDNDDNIANVVFDCGTLSKARQLNAEIKDLQMDGLKKIDAIFISHFHTDHISKINELLRIFTVNSLYVPILTKNLILEGFLYNFIITKHAYCRANRFLRRLYDDKILDVKIYQIRENSMKIIDTIAPSPWQYIPFSLDNDSDKLVKTLQTDPDFNAVFRNDRVDTFRMVRTMRRVGVKKCKEIYESVYGKERHNSYSLTLFSGISNCGQHCAYNPYLLVDEDYKFCPLNCLYTGDFEASNNDNFAKLKKFYSEYWDSIGILQVPHHGSEHNLNCGLYTPPKLCIISAGIKDRYGHPDQQTLKAIHRMGCQYRKVTEKPETKMKFEIIV